MFGLADLAPSQKKVTAKNNPGVVPKDTAMVESLDKEMRFSGVDGFELSQVVIAGHQKMYENILKCKENDPEYVPTQASSIPLVRMSRRLCGAYTMDESENKKHMPDSIGMTGDWRKRGPAFEIPFGTLYCREVPNLLTAAGTSPSPTPCGTSPASFRPAPSQDRRQAPPPPCPTISLRWTSRRCSGGWPPRACAFTGVGNCFR
jgi:hypothetical protein